VKIQQNLWEAARAVHRGKVVALNVLEKDQRKLSFHHRKVAKSTVCRKQAKDKKQ
jgi:hypothetical protein